MIDFALSEDVWKAAGLRFARHAIRRRRSGATRPRRMAADFLVGAHALFNATGLLTFDGAFFHTNFPEVPLLPIK